MWGTVPRIQSYIYYNKFLQNVLDSNDANTLKVHPVVLLTDIHPSRSWLGKRRIEVRGHIEHEHGVKEASVPE